MKQNFSKIVNLLLPDYEAIPPLLVGITGLTAGIMIAIKLLL
jgi:hypothetical protein